MKIFKIIGKTLRVHRITEKGDVRVKFETDPNIHWTIYTYLLNRIESNFEIGDHLYVNKDERVVKHVLGSNWNQNMRKYLAQMGQVAEVRPNGELLINLNDKSQLLICKKLCFKISESRFTENYSDSNELHDFSSKTYYLKFFA